MTYKYFSSRTIYQVVASMETIFSIVIIIFSARTLFLYLNEKSEDSAPDNYIILYASLIGLTVAIFQIIAAFLLISSSRFDRSFDKNDYSVSKIPTLWFFLSFIHLGLLLSVVIGPLLLFNNSNGGLETLHDTLKQSLSFLFTYTICNSVFKIFFIWAMYTTLRFCKRT